MLSFFYNNQNIFTLIGIILFLIIFYFFVKSLPTKTAKKEQKTSDVTKPKDEPKPEKPNPDEKIEKTQNQEEKPENKDNDKKKQDKKPKIVQVYKRETVDKTTGEKIKEDPIYDRNVEFVNVSKNISKFKTFSEESKTEENAEEVKNEDDYGYVTDKKDDCEFCENNVKHFDHSRRMSQIMNDNTDDMFASHITEHYLNINADRHLNLDEKFNKKLFEMTEIMMDNSAKKVKIEPENEAETEESNFNEVLIEEVDEPKVSLKTALMADTILHRRKKK